MKRWKWLTAATSKIHFLPDHIEDLFDHYAASGLDAEAAESAALEAMGDPESIAAELGRIHRPWPDWLWWLSRGLYHPCNPCRYAPNRRLVLGPAAVFPHRP